MKLVLISLMAFLVFGFTGCRYVQWKMVISSPQNGANVTTASINLNGYLYLTNSHAQDSKILNKLNAGQREELQKKIPALSGNIYCNSKKATINTAQRTWLLNELPLTHQGSNSIFCYYQDAEGNTSQQTITVNYKPQGNLPPIASFLASPTTGTAPLNVHFDASASHDSDGTIASYTWSFSDQGSATGSIVDHTFTTAGTYFANLTVTDNSGATNSYSQSIVVIGSVGNVSDGTELWSLGVLALATDPNNQFHPLTDDITFNVTGTQLKTNLDSLKIILNGKEIASSLATISANQIQLSGVQFESGKNELLITAYDTNNLPLQDTFIIWAGDQTVSINAVDENNNSVSDLEISIKLLNDQKFLKDVTHVNSGVTFENLPNQSFVLIAKKGNLLGIKTIASLSSNETITLLGIKPVSNIANDDFSQGTDGWDISEATPTIVPHSNKFDFLRKYKANDQDMRLSLENATFQKVTRTITVSGTQTKFYDLRYKFSQSADDILQIVLRNATTGEISNVVNAKKEESYWKNIRVVAKSGDILQAEISLSKSVKNNLKDSITDLLLDGLTGTTFSVENLQLYNLNTVQPQSTIVGLSVGQRVPFSSSYNDPANPVTNGSNNTKLRGSFLLTGEGTVLTDIKIVAQQLYSLGNTIQRAEATIVSSVATNILGRPIPAGGFLVTNQIIFEFPEGSLDQFDGNGLIQLDIVGTSTIPLYTQYPNLLIPLVQYTGDLVNYRMNTNRDPMEGGDDWMRSYVIPYLDSLLSSFANDSKFNLKYNDITKMNGGKPSDHSSHREGNDVDLRIAGYCTIPTPIPQDPPFCLLNNTKENAQNIIDLLNNYPFLSRIQNNGIYIEYDSSADLYKYFQYTCLKDNRQALDVIDDVAPHKDHFHVRFQETPIVNLAPNVLFGFPNSPLKEQTINIIGADATNGNLKVDWGDGNTDTVTTSCSVNHSFANNGPYTIRGMYLKNSTCIGFKKDISITTPATLQPCITAVPSNFGSVTLSSCSTGKIAKFRWDNLPGPAGEGTKGCGLTGPITIGGLSNGSHSATLTIWGVDGTTKSVTKTFTTSNGDKKILILSSEDKIVSERLPSSILACGTNESLPVAAFTSTVNIQSAKLNASISTSSSEILTYEWSAPQSNSPSQVTCFPEASFGFSSGGTYQIKLKVTNFDGLTSKEITKNVIVPGTGD